MKTAFIALLPAIVGLAFAKPLPSPVSPCICASEATQWLNKFIGVLGKTDPNMASTANQIVANGFSEHSNSILSLQHLPLGPGVAAASKEAWVQGVLHAPAPKGINTIEVFNTCDKILWYWNFTNIGSGQYPAKGFNLFHMIRNGTQLQAQRLDIEFDSIAWGLNTHLKVTYPDGTVLG